MLLRQRIETIRRCPAVFSVVFHYRDAGSRRRWETVRGLGGPRQALMVMVRSVQRSQLLVLLVESLPSLLRSHDDIPRTHLGHDPPVHPRSDNPVDHMRTDLPSNGKVHTNGASSDGQVHLDIDVSR